MSGSGEPEGRKWGRVKQCCEKLAETEGKWSQEEKMFEVTSVDVVQRPPRRIGLHIKGTYPHKKQRNSGGSCGL